MVGLNQHLSSEGEVVVGQHYAFGHARGAGSVHQVAALVDGDLLQAGVQLGVILLVPDLQEILPAQDTLLGRSSEVLDDGFEL